jgi:hypothetical protein
MRITEAQLVKQFENGRARWPFFEEIERQFRLPRFLLFAVGSRETNLDPAYATGKLGDKGHGHGLFQWDDQNRPGQTPRNIPPSFRHDPRAQATKAAEMLQDLFSKHKDWLKALNAYNSGSALTSRTTGKDYGPDILERHAVLTRRYGEAAQPLAQTVAVDSNFGVPTLAETEATFRKWDGYKETPSNKTPFNDWYFGKGTAQPWCATFVSHVLFHLWAKRGLPSPCPASVAKGFAYTPSGAAWFQKRGKWTKTPTSGALVFFHWPSMGRIAHVGWVAKVDPDGSFWSWEGNTDVKGGRTGGRVILQHRSAGSIGRLGGFGLIEYGAGEAISDEEEDMFIFGVASPDPAEGGVWLLAGDGRAHHVPRPEDLEAMKRAGVKDVGPMSRDFLLRFERVHPALSESMP